VNLLQRMAGSDLRLTERPLRTVPAKIESRFAPVESLISVRICAKDASSSRRVVQEGSVLMMREEAGRKGL
jgi:hypothetical protein